MNMINRFEMNLLMAKMTNNNIMVMSKRRHPSQTFSQLNMFKNLVVWHYASVITNSQMFSTRFSWKGAIKVGQFACLALNLLCYMHCSAGPACILLVLWRLNEDCIRAPPRRVSYWDNRGKNFKNVHNESSETRNLISKYYPLDMSNIIIII